MGGPLDAVDREWREDLDIAIGEDLAVWDLRTRECVYLRRALGEDDFALRIINGNISERIEERDTDDILSRLAIVSGPVT